MPIQSRHLRNQALAFGFWTLLALSYTLSTGLSLIGEGQPPGWSRSLTWNLLNFWPWMALVPLIGWLDRRSAGRHGWRRFCLVHIPAALAVALAQTLLHLVLFWWLYGLARMPTQTLDSYLRLQFAYNYHLAILTYWVILVVLRGMDSRRRLRNERLHRARLENQLAQAQLQALRMQLQPHFLFNTLNATSALVLADPPQARLMIARLADFLRLTLEEQHAPLIPLSRELEFLACYLGIQQVRFQDRLSTGIDVDDDVLDAAVPNLILQPLVENALRHGLGHKPGPVNVRISARREDGQLYLRVDDDGLGLPATGVPDGVGLANTRSRLQVLFGDDAQLELGAIPGGGTRAEVRLPCRRYAA